MSTKPICRTFTDRLSRQDFAAAEKKALAVGAKKFFLEVRGTHTFDALQSDCV